MSAVVNNITKAEQDFNWFADELSTVSKIKAFLINPLDVGLLWSKNVKGNQTHAEQALHSGVSGAKQVLAVPSLISGVNDFVKDLMKGVRAKNDKDKALNATYAVGDFADLTSPVADIARGLDRIDLVSLSKEALSAIKTMANTGLLVGSSIGVVRSAFSIADSKKKIDSKATTPNDRSYEKKKITRTAMNLIRSICFVAMAILGLVSMIFMPMISPFVGLSLFTVAVALGMARPIYERVVNYKEK